MSAKPFYRSGYQEGRPVQRGGYLLLKLGRVCRLAGEDAQRPLQALPPFDAVCPDPGDHSFNLGGDSGDI
ncbi:MAG: hypothetical protein ABUK03_01930 [Dehalococcoidales bacterium]